MAIFGAVALVGLLGASIMTFMKGPLSTSIKLTKMNTAENQMSIGAQVAVMATASQANNGDCETAPDGFVEPIPFRTPTTEPVPTGGGLVPSTLGISKKDPWGTEYGYCVWNHGPSTAANGCDANMLAGTNSRAYPVVALISAGPDKAFTTTCRDFSVADVTGMATYWTPLICLSSPKQLRQMMILSHPSPMTKQRAHLAASGHSRRVIREQPSSARILRQRRCRPKRRRVASG